MDSLPLNRWTAWDLAAAVRAGQATSVAAVNACLARIDAREPEVRAWAHVDAAAALRQAVLADASGGDVPLRGVPIGIKDVYDTFDMPTAMGSPIYASHRPPADASVVSLLREAGAVILGKTVTAEFAGMAASDTRNPHHPGRTPGGSSSGSGAAVADFMVPLALGTQTGGSVLRPASFCGVFGFKPTYGRINRAGMKFAAESLDTVGWMARSVQDIALLDSVLSSRPVAPLASLQPLRIGFCPTHLWEFAQPETRQALQEVCTRLRQAGVAVDTFDLPAGYARLSVLREVINDYERARALAHEWRLHRPQISAPLSRSIARGLEIGHADYLASCREAEDLRLAFGGHMEGFDALLTPCVNGEAPAGLAHAGDPRFQSIWTLLHVPCLGLPTHRGPAGMPVSVQLVGPRHGDGPLLRIGQWIAEQMAQAPR